MECLCGDSRPRLSGRAKLDWRLVASPSRVFDPAGQPRAAVPTCVDETESLVPRRFCVIFTNVCSSTESLTVHFRNSEVVKTCVPHGFCAKGLPQLHQIRSGACGLAALN